MNDLRAGQVLDPAAVFLNEHATEVQEALDELVQRALQEMTQGPIAGLGDRPGPSAAAFRVVSDVSDWLDSSTDDRPAHRHALLHLAMEGLVHRLVATIDVSAG